MADFGAQKSDAVVYVVDDDPVAAAFAAAAARNAGFTARQYESAETFLNDVTVTAPCRGCVILDLHMTGMTGLELQAVLRQRSIHLPVIIVSGQGDVSTAITAMKQLAFDYFAKPVTMEMLVDSIRRAVVQDARDAVGRADAEVVQRRFITLSPREKQVMASVVAGLANKQIAARFELSEKTIEVHRGNVMRKMCVESVADLVRASLVCDPAEPKLTAG